MTTVTNTGSVNIPSPSVQSIPIKSQNEVYKGHIVNTLEEISNEKLSVTVKKALSIALLVIATLAIVGGLCLFCVAAALPALFAAPLACQMVGLVVLPIIVGLPLLGGGLGGMKEVNMIKLSARLKNKDEKTKKLLKERKFSEITVKNFLGYLNRQHKGAQSIQFNTNCKTLGEIDTLLMGDVHSNLRVRKCNTQAVKELCKGKDRVYVESNDAGLAKYMLDTSELPSDLQYRIWDDQPSRGLNVFAAAKVAGYIFEGIILAAESKWQDKATIDALSQEFDKRCAQYPKLTPDPKKFHKFKTPATCREACKLLAMKVTEYVENLKIERRDWIKDTWLHRQNHLTQVLKKDETDLRQSGSLTFVDAGRLHLLTEKNEGDIEPVLKKYLESSGRKYLIMGATAMPKKAQTPLLNGKRVLVVPSSKGKEMTLSNFFSLPPDATLSATFRLLKIRKEAALAVL